MIHHRLSLNKSLSRKRTPPGVRFLTKTAKSVKISGTFTTNHKEGFVHLINDRVATGGQRMTVLDSGLTVITVDTGSAFFEANIIVASGLYQDRVPGTAHFLEHLLYEGPARSGIHPLLAGFSHEGDAWTGPCATGYDVTGYTADAEGIIRALLKVVFGDPANFLTEETFRGERPIIASEIRSQWQSRRFSRLLSKALFPSREDRPFSPSGNLETLRQISLRDLVNFYDDHYGPGNVALIVTGGVQHDHVVQWAQEQAARCISERTPLMRDQPRFTRFVYKDPSDDPSMRLYFPRPDSEREVRFTQLVIFLLTEPAGLFWHKLRLARGIYGFSGSVGGREDGDVQLLIEDPESDEVAQIVLGCLKNIADGDFDLSVLDREVASARREDLQRIEALDGKASYPVWSKLLHAHWLYEGEYEIVLIEEIPEDELFPGVQNAARTLLDGPRGRIVTVN